MGVVFCVCLIAGRSVLVGMLLPSNSSLADTSRSRTNYGTRDMKYRAGGVAWHGNDGRGALMFRARIRSWDG